jgi:hypothetical protein
VSPVSEGAFCPTAIVQEPLGAVFIRCGGDLRVKATPEEAEAFRRWLLAAAQAAADAGKEGGFMGFGAERVSAGEQRMLEQVRAAVGVA